MIECALGGWELERTLETLRIHPRWCASGSFDGLDFAIRKAMPGRGVDTFIGVIEKLFTNPEHWLRMRLLHALKIDTWVQDKLTPSQWCERVSP